MWTVTVAKLLFWHHHVDETAINLVLKVINTHGVMSPWDAMNSCCRLLQGRGKDKLNTWDKTRRETILERHSWECAGQVAKTRVTFATLIYHTKPRGLTMQYCGLKIRTSDQWHPQCNDITRYILICVYCIYTVYIIYHTAKFGVGEWTYGLRQMMLKSLFETQVQYTVYSIDVLQVRMYVLPLLTWPVAGDDRSFLARTSFVGAARIHFNRTRFKRVSSPLTYMHGQPTCPIMDKDVLRFARTLPIIGFIIAQKVSNGFVS